MLATLSLAALAAAVADPVEEYTAKSVLSLNLARFSEWSSEAFKDNNTSVNLCLLGDAAIQQAFSLINKKQVGNRTLTVLNINDDKQLDQCHLLYISAEWHIPARLFEESFKRHILTIGEAEDFLKHGGMVYLDIANAKINLNINLSATQKAGIQISSRVLKLATIFNP